MKRILELLSTGLSFALLISSLPFLALFWIGHGIVALSAFILEEILEIATDLLPKYDRPRKQKLTKDPEIEKMLSCKYYFEDHLPGATIKCAVNPCSSCLDCTTGEKP
jgi:hypothetical protein